MHVNEAMFDPRTYDAIRRPAVEASTLPPYCYTSPEFYRAEVKHMFMKVWNFIGRADRIPQTGDYFALDYVGVPIIVMRGRDGVVRAFANTCRHRGARLIDQEMIDTIGNTRGLKCPYHGWVYGMSGELRGCPGMEKTIGFDKDRYGLMPVRVETWGGFLFINFDENAAPLLEYLGDMPQALEALRLREPPPYADQGARGGLQLEDPHRERDGGIPPSLRARLDAEPPRFRALRRAGHRCMDGHPRAPRGHAGAAGGGPQARLPDDSGHLRPRGRRHQLRVHQSVDHAGHDDRLRLVHRAASARADAHAGRGRAPAFPRPRCSGPISRNGPSTTTSAGTNRSAKTTKSRASSSAACPRRWRSPGGCRVTST